MSEKNVFSLKKALEQVGEEKEVLKEIVDIFLKEKPKQISKLQKSITVNDAAQVAYMAHTIKGAVGNFGADFTFDAACKLEMIGKGGDLSGAKVVLDSLIQELNKLEEELKNI